MSLGYMSILDRVMGRWRPRRQRCALALAGGGVIGGMYEVGVITAIEERLNGNSGFDIYVGCSAGSVVASLLANGVRASEIYRVIDQDLEHPLNFRRGAAEEIDPVVVALAKPFVDSAPHRPAEAGRCEIAR